MYYIRVFFDPRVYHLAHCRLESRPQIKWKLEEDSQLFLFLHLTKNWKIFLSKMAALNLQISRVFHAHENHLVKGHLWFIGFAYLKGFSVGCCCQRPGLQLCIEPKIHPQILKVFIEQNKGVIGEFTGVALAETNGEPPRKICPRAQGSRIISQPSTIFQGRTGLLACWSVQILWDG